MSRWATQRASPHSSRVGPGAAEAVREVGSRMKMDVNVSLPKGAGRDRGRGDRVVVLLAWIGGEAHYGNCLEKAPWSIR